MANCVGKENYRFFFWFLVTVTLNAIYISGSTLCFLAIEGWDGSVAPVSIVIFTILLLISLLGLACYHCYLVAINVTTHEQVIELIGSSKIPNNER